LGSKLDVKIFWTKWYKAFTEFSLFLISSQMQFWFVRVFPKYLNWPHVQKIYYPLCCDVVLHSYH
jgi:hypothetical protein